METPSVYSDSENDEEYSDNEEENDTEHNDYSSESGSEIDEDGETELHENEIVDTQFVAKNGMVWDTNHQNYDRRRSENVINMRPGVTQYAASRITTTKSAFELFMKQDLCEMIVKYTNAFGRENISEWVDIDLDTLNAYFGVLLLAGAYK